MASQGAFISVPARRTLRKTSVASTHHSNPSMKTNGTNGSSETAKPKRNWPQPVREYVQRAFAAENHLPDVDRQEMESKLKQVISESAENDTLTAIDWHHLLLPQEMIRRERSKSPLTWTTTPSTPPIQQSNITIDSPPSKKRKSSDKETIQDTNGHAPPWRDSASRSVFEDRISYPEKKLKHSTADQGSSKSNQNLDSRKKRFDTDRTGQSDSNPWRSPYAEPAVEVSEGPVVGKCQDLEKRYFRLTSAPNPDSVRPIAILEKSLDYLKKKWKKENNYSYICDQFKSLRQDLTVQHIKTEFTVNVYEIHARIALEKQDLSEYNQCQTQLRALYSQKLGGHPTEFLAYRILYFLHTSNSTDMNDVLADLTPAEKQDVAVRHALDVRATLALNNYHKFFQLYLETPNMGAYLMDMFVGRERLAALSNVCKAYKPDVKLRFITEELGFESDEETARFVCEHNGQAFLEQRIDGVRLLADKARSFFEPAVKAAFMKVDMKIRA